MNLVKVNPSGISNIGSYKCGEFIIGGHKRKIHNLFCAHCTVIVDNWWEQAKNSTVISLITRKGFSGNNMKKISYLYFPSNSIPMS